MDWDDRLTNLGAHFAGQIAEFTPEQQSAVLAALDANNADMAAAVRKHFKDQGLTLASPQSVEMTPETKKVVDELTGSLEQTPQQAFTEATVLINSMDRFTKATRGIKKKRRKAEAAIKQVSKIALAFADLQPDMVLAREVLNTDVETVITDIITTLDAINTELDELSVVDINAGLTRLGRVLSNKSAKPLQIQKGNFAMTINVNVKLGKKDMIQLLHAGKGTADDNFVTKKELGA
jgi:hypothetical protein